MSEIHEGGCLCGAVRYKVSSKPQRVAICHCTFCQRFTGTAYLVEPVFLRSDVEFSGSEPKGYDHQSDCSGKRVTVKFCSTCGTNLYLDLERYPDILGLCGGTFDDPNWFDRGQGIGRHIFTRSVQRDVVIPAGIDAYEAAAIKNDGAPNEPTVFAHAMQLRTGSDNQS